MSRIHHKSNMTRKSLRPKGEEKEDRDEHGSSLDCLPDDVLYVILLKLDIQSLGRVCRTCRRLRSLAEADFVWTRHGEQNTLIQESSWCDQKQKIVSKHTECSYKEKIRLSYNWEAGVFQSTVITQNPVKQMPWLRFDETGLWVSSEQHIKCFSTRRHRGPKHHLHTLGGVKHDVTHFTLQGESVIAGCSDGSIVRWNKTSEKPTFTYKVHDDHIHKVDVRENLIFSGSADNTIRITDTDQLAAKSRVVKVIEVEERVWSVAVSPDGRWCVGGTAASTDETPPLIVWDVESLTKFCNLGTQHKKGAGVFDMKFESPNLLLTSGYDTVIRLWDMRTHTCVCNWVEPFDYANYCIQSDNNMAMFTGTARSSMTRLWDKRKSKPVGIYHPPGRRRDSPVYSIAYDTSKLFVALDLSIHMLDFSVNR
ncbi:F-box/WD repeat-containing protein 4-like [Pecten maximus]|uniref:F-box/WD repeat-containing protein 4-like n=1 Tax=Pecten maximus TaxID=6579 RepID=UPI0014581A14|nr:F-box/WD repeat-containing protein 4-like [Pecten maximus]XP_033757214.1 F-box/WD repeat-containing protein 4-like [Pecten maximus]XP_033757215.1 F-box/WD repeat-containing protein 4-like [Pecten maximus]